MLVLAIDTCDPRGSIALLRDHSTLATAAHDSAEEYSSWLLPSVEDVLRKSAVNMPDVDLFAVAAGPGSFTGVRVGLTTVKAWAEVYGKPIAAVSRLEAIALQAMEGTKYAAAWADARRGQVFGALYQCGDDGLHRIADEMVIAPARFIETVAELSAGQRISWATTDPACLLDTDEWCAREKFNEALEVVSPHLAQAIARIGVKQWKKGQVVDALALDANYVRRSDAELLWKPGAKSAAQTK